MASRELSILVAAKGALKAAKDIGKVDKATSGLGRTAGRLAKGAAIGVGAVVGVGAAIIAKNVKSGLESLATLEDAQSQVRAAAVSRGKDFLGIDPAKVSGWANEIEASVGAAFDDKDITSASANLIRFGKVAKTNLRPAMVVMTDLATKTGSVESASALLGKVLADPTKAAGKLAKAGVILTKEQIDLIKSLDAAGDSAGAQKVILDALATTTKGAALASVGPYRRSMNILADVTEDAQRALAEGFLPILEEVRDFLSTELAKPATIQKIRDLGKGLAGGLRSLIDMAKGLPWSSIGDAFKLMGTGAKAALDMFTGMPPWVQTAVVTGWGLNKLSGGLLGNVVGELGKGLIKGVLGMNAAVVNINAATVNGAGGIPGVGAAGGGLLSFAAGGLLMVSIAAIAPAALVVLTETLLGGAKAIQERDRIARTATIAARGGSGAAPNSHLEGGRGGVHVSNGPSASSTPPWVGPISERILDQKAAVDRARTSAESNRIALQSSIRTGDSQIVAAIRGIRLNITVPVTVNGGFTRRITTRTGTTLVRIGGAGAAGAAAGA